MRSDDDDAAWRLRPWSEMRHDLIGGGLLLLMMAVVILGAFGLLGCQPVVPAAHAGREGQNGEGGSQSQSRGMTHLGPERPVEKGSRSPTPYLDLPPRRFLPVGQDPPSPTLLQRLCTLLRALFT